MKTTRLSLVALVAVSGLFAGGDIEPVTPVVSTPAVVTESSSDLELSANVALTSNYVWRGISQTSNSPAIQGGFDVGYKGLYAGVWGSNIEFGPDYEASMELDVYGGYAGELYGVGYDIGYIQYAYPHNSKELNFGEAYVGLSKAFGDLELAGKYYFGVDAPDGADKLDYYEVGGSYALPYDMSFGATYGDYEDIGSNYKLDLSKEFGKFTASIAYTDFEADTLSGLEDEDHIVGTLSASF